MTKPHFTLAEFFFSETATRLGINNTTATPSILNNLEALRVNILEPIRAHFGKPFVPNSVYRSPKLNKALRSKPTSQHVEGKAADFEIPGVRNIDLARWIERNIPEFDQLLLEFYSPIDPTAGWVHVSYSEGANRREVLTIGKSGVKRGLPDK